MPLAVAEVELTHPLGDLVFDPTYRGAHVLLRRDGVPVDFVLVALTEGRCPADRLAEPMRRSARAQRRIGKRLPPRLAAAALPPEPPLVTVTVCTRDRPDDLRRCLAALDRLDYAALDRLVIDNAPSDDRTERLVREAFPNVRYVREPWPGLNRARNRAIEEARGTWIAFTDDDTEADPSWIRGIVQAIADYPGAEAITGLTLPAALDTRAHLVFEAAGTFARGFEQRRFARDRARTHLSPGLFGAGANMAFRRDALVRLGGFDPALDVGTPTNGGGDIEMFLRLIEEGGVLVYEPRALVRHHHRREMDALARQFAGWGAYYAVLQRTAQAYPHLRGAALRRGLAWFLRRHLARPLKRAILPSPVPWSLLTAERVGVWDGLTSLDRSRAEAARLDADQAVASRLNSPLPEASAA